MSVLFHDKDRRSQLTQPQISRYRSRFRGPRESSEINLEIHQTYYDVARLYARANDMVQTMAEHRETLWDGGTVVDAVAIEGLTELITRVDRLRSRVAALEV